MPCLCYCFIGKLKMSQLVNPEMFQLQSILIFAIFSIVGRGKEKCSR